MTELTNSTSIGGYDASQSLNNTSSNNANAQGSTDEAQGFLPFTLLLWRTAKALALVDYPSKIRTMLSTVRGLTSPSWRELSALL